MLITVSSKDMLIKFQSVDSTYLHFYNRRDICVSLRSRISTKMKSFLLLITVFIVVSCCNVSLAIILEVPGYGTLNGTEGTSIYTNRPFHEFRSVYYAEEPTPEVRFLVNCYLFIFQKLTYSNCYFIFKLNSNFIIKPPVPKAPFPAGQIVDATANNLGCALPLGLEDCLSLNIFTPANVKQQRFLYIYFTFKDLSL